MKYTPEVILDLCIDVFDVEGVGVSTAKIAKAVGVSNGTLFNYFPTKQELVDALYLRLKRGLADALGTPNSELPLREQTRTITQRWFDWAAEQPARYRVCDLLQQSGLAGPEAIAEASAALNGPREVLHRLADTGLLVDLPPTYIAQLVQSYIELAVDVGLNLEQRNTAFDAMWNSITHADEHLRASQQHT